MATAPGYTGITKYIPCCYFSYNVSRKRLLLLGIVIVSAVTGLLIAYLTRGTTLDGQPFATMATVQGAFVGIVFSIFVLASQVSATQFTPLTLEQLSKSRGFAALLGFYVVSILTNIYLIQSPPLPITVPYLPQNWNLAFGLGTGLMTGSLLSLLIARQLLADLTTPEHLLRRTAKSVSQETFIKSNETGEPSPTPPKRTALFTIERILVTAHNNGDEYTVQQAIHHLWRGIDRVLTPPSRWKLEPLTPDPASYTEDIDIEKLLDHWTTAVTYGTKGTVDRTQQTTTAHRHLLVTLIKAEKVPEAIEQLSYLCDLSNRSLERSGDPSILSEYQALTAEIADHESSELLSRIISHHAQFVESEVKALEANDSSELNNSNDTLLSDILCNYVILLEEVWKSELSSSTNRERTDLIINQMTSDLGYIFDTFDKCSNSAARKQTLLTELQEQIIDATSALDTNSGQPIERHITLISELSISLDREPDAVAMSLYQKVPDDEDRLGVLINQLKRWPPDDTYQREFRILAVEQDEIAEFVESVRTEISQLRNGTVTE